MPPARPDIIDGRSSAVPFAQRRACSGCRAIKSRCMVLKEGECCSRCKRLGLDCNFLQHHRGVKRSDSLETIPRSSTSTDRLSKAKITGSSTIVRPTVKKQPSSPGTLAAASTQKIMTASKSALHSFSIESMLAVDDSAMATGNRALLGSTTFATLQEADDAEQNESSNGKTVLRDTPPKAYQGIIESFMSTSIVSKDEALGLIDFYYERLNPIIALLDPQIYTADALLNNDVNRMLLASVCTVSAKFCMPDTYNDCLDFLQEPLSRIASQDVAPSMDYVLSLSILAMWKHPQDGTSWRKLRLAITMALELGLHHAFDDVFSASSRAASKRRVPNRHTVQKQRTFLQLACFEDGYQDQRRIPMAIDKSLLPEPWQWIEYLGDAVQDIDIRLAASRENALVKQDLWHKLKTGGGGAKGAASKAVALRRVQLIEMAIAAENANTRVWKDPQSYGLGLGRSHSGRPCLLFHTANTMFNYHRALYAVYCSPSLRNIDQAYKRNVFIDCCRFSIELFELIAGPYGQQDYFRYVHDIVILNLAVAAVWISDNWCEMPGQLAGQAANAVETAAAVTSSCIHRHTEQAAYLARFLSFCAKRISLLRVNHVQHDQTGTFDQQFINTPYLANALVSHPAAVTHTFPAAVEATTASSVSPDARSIGSTGDPVLQYLEDLLSMPCVQMDDRDSHNILSFFHDDRNKLV